MIKAAVVSVGDEKCLRAAATCIGMNKRSIQRAFKRRELLNQGAHGEVWAKHARKKRKDALTEDVITLVVSWWTTETRVSPCKKDVRKLKIGVKLYQTHARHFLEESQLKFYSRFKGAHVEVKVSFTAFRRLQPYFVKMLKDFNSCCCIYH